VTVTVEGKAGRLVINGPGVPVAEQLKVDFSGSLTLGSAQNAGKVTIWNLTKSHRGGLGEEFDKLTLEIGYEQGQPGILIKGDIRDVTHALDGADVSSEIDVGDGDEAIQKGLVSKTFPAGSKPKDVISHIISTMPGVSAGAMVGLDALPPYKRAVALFGFCKRELDTIGREHGVYWSIQNGKVEAIKNDRYIDDVVVLSKQTGLIGVPEVTDKGIKARCLITPRIRPNRLVDVRSQFLDEASGRGKQGSDQGGGLFRVATVAFSGTSRGPEFYLDIEGNRVQGGKVTK